MSVKVKKKKEQIYIEAARLFMEKGYPSTSMRDLASAVDLEVSSLYSHIKSKEEILQDICFECAAQFLSGIDSIIASPGNAAVKLRALIALHLDIAMDDPGSITVFNDEWRHLSEPYLSDFLQLRRNYEKKFLGMLEEGISTGDLSENDPVIVMNSIISSMRWVHWKHKPTFAKKELLQNLTSMFLQGMEQNTKKIQS